MGWMFDSKATPVLVDTTNCKDMKNQEFYKWLKTNYLNTVMAQPVLYFALGSLTGIGGMPAVVWGFGVRTVFTWHVTWAVNSICHVYGKQQYNTGDISMNNALVGILTHGEGWHNNHHAFETSCRHGLKWW